MREQQRLDYLQAMGITQWIPRQPLPFAPAPRWLAEDAHPRHANPHQVAAGGGHMPHPLASELLHDAAADKPAAVAQAPSAAQVAAVASHAPGNVLPADAVSANVAPASVAPTSVAPTNVADLTPPRFELHFLRAGHGLWVADSLAAAEKMQAFAWRVLNALQGRSDFIGSPLCFRWPFIESAHEDQSLPVALHALTAQWQFLRDQGASYVIALGADSTQWLSRIQVQPLFSASSLQDVMTTATEKRRLWQALQQQSEL